MLNQVNYPFAITLLAAAAMAAYTLFAGKWWLKNQKKISNDWIKLGVSLVVAAALIFAPMLLLSVLGDALYGDQDQEVRGNHNFWVLLVWAMPPFAILGYDAVKEHKAKSKKQASE